MSKNVSSQPKAKTTRTLEDILALNLKLNVSHLSGIVAGYGADVEKWRAEIREAEYVVATLVQAFKLKSELAKELVSKREELNGSRSDKINDIDHVLKNLQVWLQEVKPWFNQISEQRQELLEGDDSGVHFFAFLLPGREEELKSYHERAKKDSTKVEAYSKEIEKAFNKWKSAEKNKELGNKRTRETPKASKK